LNDNPVASPGHSYPTAVLSAVPWLRELDNEPVTDTLRESVLQGLLAGRAGLLTGLLRRVQANERLSQRNATKRVVSCDYNRDNNPGGFEEDVDGDSDGGADLARETDPLKRVSTLWGRVLRAVELGEKEGLLPAQDPSVREAGIRHQRFCAEWRRKLVRSAREQAAGPLESGGSKAAGFGGLGTAAFRGLGTAGFGGLGTAGFGGAGTEGFGVLGTAGLEEFGPVSDGAGNGDGRQSRGSEDGADSAPRNGKAPSLLVRQLQRCFQKHVRFEASEERILDVRRNEAYFQQEQRKRTELVTRVQAIWRGRQARIRSGLLGEERRAQRKAAERASAVRIQALWRGFVARKEQRMRRRHVDAREAAARTVQASWRGHFLRKKIERAFAAAKYVDEDDFDYGDGPEALLTGFEGLSRLGTISGFEGLSRPGSSRAGSLEKLGYPTAVKKDNWVSPIAAPPGKEMGQGTQFGGRVRPDNPGVEGVVKEGSESVVKQDSRDAERNPAPGKLAPIAWPARNQDGIGFGDGPDVGGNLRSPSGVKRDLVHLKGENANHFRHSDNLAMELYSSLQRPTDELPVLDALSQKGLSNNPTSRRHGGNVLERPPLKAIHTSPSSQDRFSVNDSPSSVVPLPTISPERSASSSSQDENIRESRFSLPEIRLGSSQPEPTWRTVKRFSEPVGGFRDSESVRSSSEMTPRQLSEDASVRGSIQSTPRGPHVSKSQRKMERQRQSISEIAQEWSVLGFLVLLAPLPRRPYFVFPPGKTGFALADIRNGLILEVRQKIVAAWWINSQLACLFKAVVR
jgi:hypothetical protein